MVGTRPSDMSEMEQAICDLENGCTLYCMWFDTGKPQMEGSAVAYELVSCMRQALAKLKDRSRQAERVQAAREYAELCRKAMKGDIDAAEQIGDSDDAIEVLCDYVSYLTTT